MTLDAFIDGMFDREGRTYAEPPQIDQPTAGGGVTLPALSAYRGHPCTVDDLRRLTIPEATAILRWTIARTLTRWRFDQIADEGLRLQLLDFAWNSGEALAVRWLQRTLLLPEADVDGAIGPQTLAALARLDPVLVNNALAAERAHMVLSSTTMADKFKNGVIHRALTFVRARKAQS